MYMAVNHFVNLMTGLQPLSIMNICHKGTDWVSEYNTIATEAIVYAFSHEPLFSGDLNKDGVINDEDYSLGQFYTAGLFIAIAHHETGFIRTVTGDHGNSICFMQINRHNDYRINSGWTKNEIIQDDQKCFELGYLSLKNSFKVSGNLTQKLKIYASGQPNRGTAAAHQRCKTFAEIMELPVAAWCGY